VNAASLRPRPLGAAGLAARLGTTAAALALAFPFTNVLFRATSPEQVRADCAAIGLLGQLKPAEVADLRRIGRPADPAPAVP
jgi:aryl-alcohol dehydrogenase-like predicted oxidoreductase